MADQKRPSSENRYSVEIDGIPAFKATKITGGDEKHEPVKVVVGNDPYAKLGRGNVKPEEVQITIPSGLYDSAIKALAAWLKRYNDGDDTTPKSGRYMTYDDRGKSPIETWELRDCVPIALKPDDKTGEGTNASTVTLTLLPEKIRRL